MTLLHQTFGIKTKCTGQQILYWNLKKWFREIQLNSMIRKLLGLLAILRSVYFIPYPRTVVCSSVCKHEATRKQLNKLSSNLVLVSPPETCRHIRTWLISDKHNGHFTQRSTSVSVHILLNICRSEKWFGQNWREAKHILHVEATFSLCRTVFEIIKPMWCFAYIYELMYSVINIDL